MSLGLVQRNNHFAMVHSFPRFTHFEFEVRVRPGSRLYQAWCFSRTDAGHKKRLLSKSLRCQFTV